MTDLAKNSDSKTAPAAKYLVPVIDCVTIFQKTGGTLGA